MLAYLIGYLAGYVIVGSGRALMSSTKGQAFVDRLFVGTGLSRSDRRRLTFLQSNFEKS